MWHCDSENRITKRGRVVRIVRERYLRDDISCQSELCEYCPIDVEKRLEKMPFTGKYLVPDVNTVLCQMDVFEFAEAPELTNVIILETVMNQVKKQDLAIYNRLHSLIKSSDRRFIVFANEHHCEHFIRSSGQKLTEKKDEIIHSRLKDETMEQRNERAIRISVKWYEKHLTPNDSNEEDFNERKRKLKSCENKCNVQVVLLVNDESLVKAAKEDGIEHVSTIHSFVKAMGPKYPQLVDLLSAINVEAGKSTGSEQIYREHLLMSELLNGIKNKKFFQGTLRCNRNHWSECSVMVYGLNSDGTGNSKVKIPVLIQGISNINRAMDGDIVAIQLLPRSEWKKPADSFSKNDGSEVIDEADKKDDVDEINIAEPTISPTQAEIISAEESEATTSSLKPCGRVVGIIKRNWRRYCGSLEVKGKSKNDQPAIQSSSCLFIPVDRKVPKIRIKTRQRDLLIDKRILVCIDSWPVDSRYPNGHYVQTIGLIGEKQTETQVLLIEHDIPTAEFSEKVMACLPPSSWSITPENSVGREDFRGLPVMSIDPPGCKDIDDALHYRKLQNGNIEIGVHIADVTYFVKPGNELDLEAADRGTSTYLVDRRLDMLPGLLTTELCSLKGNEDHFAFSVVWEVELNKETQSINVVDVKFCKSIIHSISAMSYNEAQILLDDKSSLPNNIDQSTPNRDVMRFGVHGLHEIATILRKRRLDAGALTLASPEVRFVLDTETQNPLDVEMYTIRDTNSLVEEFMLLANITVAKKILRHFPSVSLLRRHPAPSRRQFDGLISAVKSLGLEINVDDSKQLADSLDRVKAYAEKNKNKNYLNKLIRILTTRCMMPAQYFCSGEFEEKEFHHYGLAAPIYTHFTSPIRRYADVVVHRLLSAAIGISPLPEFLEKKEKLNEVCDKINIRHHSAQMAGRASVSLHTLLYFKENPTETNAIIIRVKSNGIGVLLPRFGIEGMVILGNKDTLDYDESNHVLSKKDNKNVFLSIFQKIEVSVYVELTFGSRQELKMEIVSPHEWQKSKDGDSPVHLAVDEGRNNDRKKRKTVQ